MDNYILWGFAALVGIIVPICAFGYGMFVEYHNYRKRRDAKIIKERGYLPIG